MENLAPSEMFFTGPMVLSHDMMKVLKQKIVDLIAELQSEVKHAKDEKMACLNIDLFELE